MHILNYPLVLFFVVSFDLLPTVYFTYRMHLRRTRPSSAVYSIVSILLLGVLQQQFEALPIANWVRSCHAYYR